MINKPLSNIPPAMRQAATNVFQKTAFNNHQISDPNQASSSHQATATTSSTEDLERALPQLAELVNSNPTLRASLRDVMKSLESFQGDLRKNTTEVSPVYKAASAAVIVAALGLTLSQGVRAFNDVKNGKSDGQFITLFSSQGAKIAAVLTTLLQPNANNAETNYNLLRYYGLPNAIASTSFEFIKNQPIAIATTVAGTMAGFHSLELNDWMKNAEHSRPTPTTQLYAGLPDPAEDTEVGQGEINHSLDGLEGYKLLQSIVAAVTDDIQEADALITSMVGGLRASGEEVQRVGTAELNILESSHRIMSDKIGHLKSQAGIPPEKSIVSAAERAKSGYFIALQQLIGNTSVALSKTPTDQFSSLADIASVGSLMAAKTLGGATGQAIQQLFKDLMSLTTLWLPIQAANALHAQTSERGVGFLDRHETQNIMLSIAALSTAMLTIAGPVSKVGADTLGVPISAATKAYQKFFGKSEQPEANQSATNLNGAATERAHTDNVEQRQAPAAAEVVIDIEPEEPIDHNARTTPPQDNARQSTSYSSQIYSAGRHLSKVKDAFTHYMKETFAAKNIEVVAIKPAVTDKLLERDRQDIVNTLNFESAQGYIDLLKYLTSGQPEQEISLNSVTDEHTPLNSEQKALADSAIQHALRSEEKMLATLNEKGKAPAPLAERSKEETRGQNTLLAAQKTSKPGGGIPPLQIREPGASSRFHKPSIASKLKSQLAPKHEDNKFTKMASSSVERSNSLDIERDNETPYITPPSSPARD